MHFSHEIGKENDRESQRKKVRKDQEFDHPIKSGNPLIRIWLSTNIQKNIIPKSDMPKSLKLILKETDIDTLNHREYIQD